jgi:hypothetical protein
MYDTATPTRPELMSRALTARAARVVRRLADLLDEQCSEQSGARQTAAFLRGWAGDTQVDDPRADVPMQPLDLLTAHYALTDADVDLILLAGLPEEHEGLAVTMRSLHPHGEARVSAGLAALMLGARTSDRASVRRLLTEGAAVRNGLVDLAGPGTLFERSLLCPDRLWDALHGHDGWPAGLDRVPVGAAPPGLGRWLSQAPVRRAVDALRDEADRTLLITCPDETVALGRCAALAAAAGVAVAAARVEPADAPAWQLLQAHAAARGAVPVAVISGPPPETGVIAAQLLTRRVMAGPVLVCATGGSLRVAPDRAVLPVPVDPVSTADHRDAWRHALPHLAEHAAELAARHPIDPAHTAAVALDARSQSGLADGAVGLRDVSALIRARAALSLPAGVQLVTPHVPWERLVVRDEAGLQLRDAVARLAHQSVVLDDWGMRERARASRGARLLFTGPPGTGKSLAAEAVATAAATDLLVVDVSRVVSKWIGETEKNLAGIFDAAERTQAVLFLDEADALFGARTEITDAHDRYANLETAYLLQRLDRFDGLAVLATNLGHNVDPAFQRRMDFVVDFPLPDLASRREMWRLHLPVAVLDEDVDIETLARLYPVPGGWIRNAAIAAGFLAAAGGERIGQPHLNAAVRREYDKAALPFPGESPRRLP